MSRRNVTTGEYQEDAWEGHAPSWYRDNASLPRLRAALDRNLDTSVCVVGGGLAGLTTALELARQGVDTVLIEAERIGWSASGRNGGFVSPGFAESIFEVELRVGLAQAREMYSLSRKACSYVHGVISDAGRHDIIGGRGWLKLVRHSQTGELEYSAERMARDYGSSASFLSASELTTHITSERYHAGLVDPAPFHVNPLEYCLLLAEKAERAGAVIAEGTAARRVGRRHNGGWRIRTSNGHFINASNVVIATSAHRGPSARINGAVLPVATYVVAASNGKAGFSSAIRFSGCIGDTRRASDYYRLVGDGDSQRLLWGGRITTRRSEPAKLAEMLKHDIQSVYPQLNQLEITHAWQGLMGYARHKMPLIGKIGEGLWVATAFGGHGLNTTAMAGQLIASAIGQGDDRYRLFDAYGPVYAGGLAGRLAVQGEYWRLQLVDWMEEKRAER